jgi:uncharacterized OB-fold protein
VSDTEVEVSPFPEGLWSQPGADTSAIGAIADVEAVKSIRTPARLDYTYTAGISSTRFLRGMAEGKVLGERCPKCGKVYVPSRGACPVDGVPTEEVVELPSVGTVVSFCIVNVEFTGRGIEIPYASALVVCDGADLALFGLIQEVPHDQVRMGMRVEAKWKDPADWETSFENIEYWRPNGEPDADYESYKEFV